MESKRAIGRGAPRALIIALVALWAYDQVIYFYGDLHDFVSYAVVPTVVVIMGLIMFYLLPGRRRAERRRVEIITGNSEAEMKTLEERLDEYRRKAGDDPSKLPDLVERLAFLSVYYREREPEKAANYAREAMAYLNSPNYPSNEAALTVRKIVELIIFSRTTST
ncbi:hypothetical protein GCM10007981_10610 [Thermocladium modestius]|uniref:Tetratricopeptide repeat protein n=1 Tax=Thermocladium modestius TaxID=62609 RepID=A0A830GTZ5_9CREN|nr:hypothetical protein [Thermocladium modestius]GGP20854.1 hypothetical protein GCM10007981_10610 [Thermocladium modestius]